MRVFFDTSYRAVQRLRGERVYETLALLEESQWYDADRIARMQWQQLKALIARAYENVPYYRHQFNEAGLTPDRIRDPHDFAKVPVLTKNDLRDSLYSLKAQDRHYATDRYSSSGSTGPSSIVLADRKAAAYRHAAVFRMRSWMGLRSTDRMVIFWGSQLDLKSRLKVSAKDFFLNRKTFSTHALDEQQMARYYRTIRRFKPKLIYGFTSAVYEFARFLETRNRGHNSLGITAVLVTGEPVFEYQKTVIQKNLGCPVYIQYGAEEFGPIAYQCPDGGLHVMAENVYVEVEAPPGAGSKGSLLITGIQNFAMPLLRYRLGDVGVISEYRCRCGRGLPLVQEISGRSVDFIKTPDGKIMHGINFDYLPKYFLNEIKQFQIIQTDIDRICINIVKDTGFTEQTPGHFEKKLREIIGDKIHIRYVFMAELPREATGKTRFVLSRLNPNEARG